MFINEINKLTVKLDGKIVQGDVLKVLFNFCFSLSDTISLSQSSNKGMTKEESDQAIVEYNEFLKENELYEELKPSKEDILELYKEIAETEEEYNALVQREKEVRDKFEANFLKSKDDVAPYVRGLLENLNLVDRNVTCMTPCTHGEPSVMYYFTINEGMKDVFYHMENLFSSVIIKEEQGILLDDPCFYHKGKLILSISSHENFGTIFLDELQYKELLKLKLNLS